MDLNKHKNPSFAFSITFTFAGTGPEESRCEMERLNAKSSRTQQPQFANDGPRDFDQPAVIEQLFA